jgi:hypothetical protein
MNLPYHNQLKIEKFEKMLDIKNIHNSYKILWLNAIIEKIETGRLSISFSEIVYSMLIKSFDLVSVYHLKYGGTDILPNIIKSYPSKNISDFEKSISTHDLHLITQKVTVFVPYRLLSSFYYEKLINIPDSQKNNIIAKLSNADKLSFYSISSKEKTITVNPFWASYIMDNITIIRKWIDYNLIIFLQRRNPSSPNIPFKVNPIKNRNLAKAKNLWNKAIQVNPALSFDIYINSSFTEESVSLLGPLSIDHFLPWSFVSHDLLWNLLPTHKNINSIKSNQLPKEKYIESFINQQYNFISTISMFCRQSDIEDYVSLNDSLRLDNFSFDYDIFRSTMFDNTLSLYKIAKNQGYNIWDNSL